MDKKEAEEEQKRSSQASKRTGRTFGTKAPAKRAAPRKNNKAVEPEAETISTSSMEVGKFGFLVLS